MHCMYWKPRHLDMKKELLSSNWSCAIQLLHSISSIASLRSKQKEGNGPAKLLVLSVETLLFLLQRAG